MHPVQIEVGLWCQVDGTRSKERCHAISDCPLVGGDSVGETRDEEAWKPVLFLVKHDEGNTVFGMRWNVPISASPAAVTAIVGRLSAVSVGCKFVLLPIDLVTAVDVAQVSSISAYVQQTLC